MKDKIEQAASMRLQGHSLSQIAGKMEVTKSTVHRWLNSYDETEDENNEEIADEDASEDEAEIPSLYRFLNAKQHQNFQVERKTNVSGRVAETNDVPLLNAFQGTERMWN